MHPSLRCGLPGYHRAGIHEVSFKIYHPDGLRLNVRIGYGPTSAASTRSVSSSSAITRPPAPGRCVTWPSS